MKNAIFWDVTPCGSRKNDGTEKRITSIIRVERIREEQRKEQLAIRSSEASVLIGAIWCHRSEDGILQTAFSTEAKTENIIVPHSTIRH
jgi:hypothetical protein